MGQRHRRMYDLKPCLVWHLTQSFQKGQRLNQKLKMKICNLEGVCKQTSLLKRITDGGLGPKPVADLGGDASPSPA